MKAGLLAVSASASLTPAATVLIPTHDRAESIRHAIASVLEQSFRDFELFIVGDGMTESARAAVAELAAGDSRIRLFDFPKGERKGERHRHAALQHATGRIVAYLGDDDLWMPDHLATLVALLSDADFGHTLHVGIGPDDALVFLPSALEDPAFRAAMLRKRFNRFDFTFGAHTLEAYRKLPEGWAPPPTGFRASDHYLWHRFLAEPWCRARSAMVPTAICTQSHLRPHMGDHERAAELARLRIEMSRPGFREKLLRQIAESFAHDAAMAFARDTHRRRSHHIRNWLRQRLGA